jgi:hypothetical protein
MSLAVVVIAGLVIISLALIVLTDLRPRKVKGTNVMDTRRVERATRDARRNAEAYRDLHGDGPGTGRP